MEGNLAGADGEAVTDDLRDCGDCGAKPGERHDPGCDVAQCALCGGQLIGCDCVYEVNGIGRSNMEATHPEIYRNGASPEMWKRYDAEVAKIGGPLVWSGTDGCVQFSNDDPGAEPDGARPAAAVPVVEPPSRAVVLSVVEAVLRDNGLVEYAATIGAVITDVNRLSSDVNQLSAEVAGLRTLLAKAHPYLRTWRWAPKALREKIEAAIGLPQKPERT